MMRVEPDALAAGDVLMNLDTATPPAFERFERLLEIADRAKTKAKG